jgi:hypothetical protein
MLCGASVTSWSLYIEKQLMQEAYSIHKTSWRVIFYMMFSYDIFCIFLSLILNKQSPRKNYYISFGYFIGNLMNLICGVLGYT